MHLLDLFESTNEAYRILPNYDKEKYGERPGLEGPIRARNGKVVYYDTKEGQYYDPDTDMYISNDEWDMMNQEHVPYGDVGLNEQDLDEGVGTYLKGAVLAGLLGLGIGQLADIASAKNTPLGKAMAQAAEQGDEYAAKHLEKLDFYMDANDTGSMKILSQKYLNKTIESVYEEVATNKRTERILGLLRAKNPTAQNDLEALIMSFDQGQKQDRQDINTLYSQNREEDKEIEELERELEALKKRRGMNEDYYETDEQRELARLGRILMDMGAKRDDDVGAAMGAVGNELTKYGSPEGVNSIKKLEQVTGQPESVIMKMMALAQKVQGDVAVGADVPDEEDVEEGYQDSLKNKIGRASDEFDVGTNNYEVKVDGKPWKVFRTKASAIKAASTIEMRYGKKTSVFATRAPVSEGIAEDFDTNFQKRVGATVRGGKGAEYLKKKAKERQAQNKELDPAADRKGLGIGVLDAEKAREKMAKRGITPPRAGFRTSPRTNDPKRLPEEVALDENASLVKDYQDMKAQGKKDSNILDALMSMPKYKRMSKDQMAKIIGDAKRKGIFKEELDHDIKIGDTVQTLKMGQMQGTVTGFSTKSGSTKVMFKHKSGKVYATPASNLKVIDTAKKSESLDDTVVEAKKKPVPTKPDKWAYAKAQAKKKFDVYPSAYANAWAAKKYKELGGGWRMGKKK